MAFTVGVVLDTTARVFFVAADEIDIIETVLMEFDPEFRAPAGLASRASSD
jgi:hypothetical protein